MVLLEYTLSYELQYIIRISNSYSIRIWKEIGVDGLFQEL